ncbi:MAG: LLM class flavin-dependent oxidoreductase [Promethearchaeota archaeon]|jgi:alkanesulfonate monooxygenase SsuD/methylene tetrahydromethanopterin reductase-like flavin-dependent oxidoreductase (luciferase family)
MKFGYYVRTVLNYPEIRDLTLRVEKLGFDSVHINDHLIGFDPEQDKREPYLESIQLLTALAVETSKVKLGNIVICNSFRNPAYLAKMISTLDNISNGRALMWLGAGWYEEEYKAYGYSFPSPKRRVDEVEESLTILKKMFTEDVTNFEGKFWQLERNRNFPKPVQKPYPQIVLGTSGKRMIDIACREADGVNLPYPSQNTFLKNQLSHKVSEIKEILKKYNKDLAEFEISLFGAITIVKDQEDLDNVIEDIIKNAPGPMKPTREYLLEHQIIGFPEDIKNRLVELENIGIDKIVFSTGKSGLEDPLMHFSKEIM